MQSAQRPTRGMTGRSYSVVRILKLDPWGKSRT
jgi:hypothetical protein